MIILIILKKYKRWICYKRNLEVWAERANQNRIFTHFIMKLIRGKCEK